MIAGFRAAATCAILWWVRFGIGFMQKKPIVFNYCYKNNQLFRLYDIKIIGHFPLLSLQNAIIAKKP